MIDPVKLAEAAQAARDTEATTGFPAQVTLCQWALESGWGDHCPGNNCFGIKEYPGCFGQQQLLTTEVFHGVAKKVYQWFATFPTLTACFQKHAQLITESPRYSIVWGNWLANRDLDEFIDGLAHFYATDPQYADKLREVLGMSDVVAALAVPAPGSEVSA
jgi:flagellum-specific peptidoglycan hydrolase FlgJ